MLRLIDLLDIVAPVVQPTTKYHERYGNIYRAKRVGDFGLSVNNEFVTGLTLVPVVEGNWYDALEENIDGVGNEFICHVPEEGLVEGSYYEAYEVCTSVDWESGWCDETEVYIKKVV